MVYPVHPRITTSATSIPVKSQSMIFPRMLLSPVWVVLAVLFMTGVIWGLCGGFYYSLNQFIALLNGIFSVL